MRKGGEGRGVFAKENGRDVRRARGERAAAAVRGRLGEGMGVRREGERVSRSTW